MITLLGHYLNKTVVVSIPILFPDGPACVGTLVSIEPAGIWLESDALTRTVHPDMEQPPESTRVFIPFAQIAYIVKGLGEETLRDPQHHDRAVKEATPAVPKRRGRGATTSNKHR